MARVYLSLVIAVMNSTFVAVVAAVTLAVSLSVCLATLNANAELALERHTAAAVTGVDSVFSRPLRVAEAVMNLQNDSLEPMPSPVDDDTIGVTEAVASPYGAVMERYLETAMRHLRSAGFRVGPAHFRFFDQTSAVIWQPEPGTVRAAVKFTGAEEPRPVQPGTPRQTVVSTAPYFPNHTFGSWEAFSATPLPLEQDMPDFTPVQFLKTPGLADKPTWGSLQTFHGHDGLWMSLVAALGNRTVQYFGEFRMLAPLSPLFSALQASKLSPAAVQFIIDAAGFVVATTDAGRPAFDTRPVELARGTGCFGLALPSGATNTTHRGCLGHMADSAFAQGALADVVQEDPDFLRRALDTPHPAIFRSAGTIAASVRLPSMIDRSVGGRMVLISVLPRAAIMGDITTFQLMSTLVAIGASIAAAAISGLVTVVLLRPLKPVAVHMAAAARFEELPPMPRSLIREVANLQRAFCDMAAELRRISSYVPHSLLFQADFDGEEPDDAEYSLVSKTATTGSEASVPLSTCHSPRSARNVVVSCRPVGCGAGSQCGTPRGSGPSASPSVASSSRHLAERSAAPKTATKLSNRISAGLSPMQVSVLAVNLRNFVRASVEDVNLAEGVAAAAEAILKAADAQRGVVDSFYGDRFVITFNATRPAAGHAGKAALASVAIKETVPTGPLRLQVTMGLSSGRVYAGGVGCASMKRFVLVGPTVPQALAFERMCKLGPEIFPDCDRDQRAICLAPGWMAVDLMAAVTIRYVDFVRVPFRREPTLIAAIGSSLTGGKDDEWMYQLAERGSGEPDQRKAATKAWRMISSGRVVELKATLDAASWAASPRLLAAVQDAVTAAACDKDPIPAAVHNLGRFYSNAVAKLPIAM